MGLLFSLGLASTFVHYPQAQDTDHISENLVKMDMSMKYFGHYFQEIQTTKDKFRDYINRNDSETEKLIEMSEISDLKQEDTEAKVDEKTAAIKRIREMARTLDDISTKIADVKEETIRLTQENAVLDEYILNLMEQSKTFEPAGLKWFLFYFPVVGFLVFVRFLCKKF